MIFRRTASCKNRPTLKRRFHRDDEQGGNESQDDNELQDDNDLQDEGEEIDPGSMSPSIFNSSSGNVGKLPAQLLSSLFPDNQYKLLNIIPIEDKIDDSEWVEEDRFSSGEDHRDK